MGKICTKCHMEKELSEFHKKRKNRYQPICKLCKKEFDRKYYLEHKDRTNKIKTNSNKQRKYNEEFTRRHKLLCGCKFCGYKKSSYSLHYHHLNDKKYTISQMKTLSIKTLKHEIRKCIVLCSNCHGELHENLKNGRVLGSNSVPAEGDCRLSSD